MEALQASPLPESAEILDILNRIEFEGLFFSHDKLAERQVGCTTFRHLYFFFGPSLASFIIWSLGSSATWAARVTNNNSSHTWIRLRMKQVKI